MNADAIRRSASRSSAAHDLAGYAGAMLLVAVSTVLGLLIEAKWGTSPVAMLYLLPVLFVASFAGLGPGLGAAIASTLA